MEGGKKGQGERTGREARRRKSEGEANEAVNKASQ